MKVPLTISIEEEDARDLRLLCDILGITQSKLFESAVKGYVIAARTSGVLRKKKASPLDLAKVWGAGMKLDPLG